MKNNNYDYSELINNIKNNDEESFNELVKLTRDHVFFRARTSVGDNQTADDICQEVFIKVFKNINNLDDPKAFIGWLDTITRNCCNEYFRKSYKKVDSETEAEVFSYDAYEDFDVADTNIENQPELAFSKKEKEELVYGIIDALPAAQKQAIMMYYYDEMKIKDIAAELEVNENTIKSRLSLAKKEIEVKVKELNKKHGIKLYNFAPFTFFVYLLKALKGENIFEAIFGKVITDSNAIKTTATKIAKTSATKAASSSIGAKAATVAASKVTLGTAIKAVGMSLASKVAIGATIVVVGATGVVAATNPELINKIIKPEPIVENVNVDDKENNIDTTVVLKASKTEEKVDGTKESDSSLSADTKNVSTSNSEKTEDKQVENKEQTGKSADEPKSETQQPTEENIVQNQDKVLPNDQNNNSDSESSQDSSDDTVSPCFFSYETNEQGFVDDPNACNYGAHIENGNNDHIFSQSYENDKGQHCVFEEDLDNIPDWVDDTTVFVGYIDDETYEMLKSGEYKNQ